MDQGPYFGLLLHLELLHFQHQLHHYNLNCSYDFFDQSMHLRYLLLPNLYPFAICICRKQIHLRSRLRLVLANLFVSEQAMDDAFDKGCQEGQFEQVITIIEDRSYYFIHFMGEVLSWDQLSMGLCHTLNARRYLHLSEGQLQLGMKLVLYYQAMNSFDSITEAQ